MSDLSIKCESAWVAHLKASATGMPDKQIFPGTGTVNKYDPCYIVECTGTGEEDPPATGNFWIQCQLRLEHSAVPNADGTNDPTDDPKADFEELLETLRQAAQQTGLAATLSGYADDFTVIGGPIFSAPTAERDEAGLWKHSINLRLLCCDSDLD